MKAPNGRVKLNRNRIRLQLLAIQWNSAIVL